MKLLPFITVLALVSVNTATAEDTRKRIYLAEDEHTDLMWSADTETYDRVFVEMLDHHLALVEKTKANSAPYRHRFNCDGSRWLRAYEQKKSPTEFDRLIGHVREGAISVPLNTVVSCYGAQPAEAVLRGMAYAGRLERQHGLRFSLAVAMENQGLPLGLASLFAGAGAKYSWRGVCACASRMSDAVLKRRPHEIYWWTGHDGQRLLLKWHSLAAEGNRHSGGYAEAFSPEEAVTRLDTDQEFLQRYRAPGAAEPFRVLGAFGFGWDALDRKAGQPYAPDQNKYPQTEPFHVVAERMTDERRQVIVSNESDFFEDFERTHAASLPSASVTFGNEWDLYSASMVQTSARVKRAVERLRGAEMLTVHVSLSQPDFMVAHRAARDRAFDALGMYWEHNWTADGPISRAQRAAWQEKLADEIVSYVDGLHADAAKQLGRQIARPKASDRFFVLNPLNWPRTDAADFSYSGPADIHVYDLAAGKDVPHQISEGQLRILADKVPGCGWKVYEIRSGRGNPQETAAATFVGNTLENDAVSLILERDGAISSLVDKSRGDHQLVAALDGLTVNDLASGQAGGEPLQVVSRGPVSVTVQARSTAGLPHVTRITLYRGLGRVDIHNEITANFTDLRHWAFSFAIKDPVTHTEEVGAVLLDRPQAAGGDYSDAHARNDYLTVNHFADMSEERGGKGVTISSPDLAFAKLGYSKPELLDWGTPQLHMLAGGQVDGPSLGIPAQGGCQQFVQRFALQPHGGYEQAAAMRFALEHQNPLITAPVTGEHKESDAAPSSYAPFSLNSQDVLLWALKVHDDGMEHGLVARVWNQSRQERVVRLQSLKPMISASRLTHLETLLEKIPTENGALEVRIGPSRMETFGLNVMPLKP